MKDSTAAADRSGKTMKLREQYDWVVLGDHPGALLSACLTARLGLATLILRLGSSRTSGVSASGQCLDPESAFVLGLGKAGKANGVVADSLGRLGLQPTEESRIDATAELLQIVTPSRRLLFSAEDDAWGRELRREFGEQVAARSGLPGALVAGELPISNYWRTLPDRYRLQEGKPSERRPTLRVEDVRKQMGASFRGRSELERMWLRTDARVGQLVARSGDASWSEVLPGLWYGAAAHSAEGEDPLLWELLQLMSVARTGAAFRGGMTAFRELLLRMAKRLGAHAPDGIECQRIFVENGRFGGIQAAGSGHMIGARGAALGCGLRNAAKVLSVTGRQWPRRLKAEPTPAGWRFTLALTVHAEAIPPGMGSRLVWQERGAPALELEVADPADYGVAEPAHRLIFLRTALPFRPETLQPESLRVAAARMLRQLAALVPFLEFHVARVYPDFRSRPEELREAYPYGTLEELPENLKVFAGEGTGTSSGIEGLFVATGEAFPALGSLGPFIAAIESAAWLAHRSGLAGPFG
jgi:hypothetical protein